MPLISVLHLLLVRAKKMREVLQEIYLTREQLPSMSRPLSTAGLYFFLKAFVLNLVPSSLICTVLISSKSIHVNKNVFPNNDEVKQAWRVQKVSPEAKSDAYCLHWDPRLHCKQNALLLKGTKFSWLQLVINSNHVFYYVLFQSYSWNCKHYSYNERGKL